MMPVLYEHHACINMCHKRGSVNSYVLKLKRDFIAESLFLIPSCSWIMSHRLSVYAHERIIHLWQQSKTSSYIIRELPRMASVHCRRLYCVASLRGQRERAQRNGADWGSCQPPPKRWRLTWTGCWRRKTNLLLLKFTDS